MDGPPGARRLHWSHPPILGRDDDLARARELLQAPTRLLTLVGPPGVGKTRLLHALVERIGPAVCIVDLTVIGEAALVLDALAAALGVRDAAAPGRFHQVGALSEPAPLLVLDNLEHLLPAARALDALLAHCPALQDADARTRGAPTHGQYVRRRVITPPGAQQRPSGGGNVPCLTRSRASRRSWWAVTIGHRPRVVAYHRSARGQFRHRRHAWGAHHRMKFTDRQPHQAKAERRIS